MNVERCLTLFANQGNTNEMFNERTTLPTGIARKRNRILVVDDVELLECSCAAGHGKLV